MWQHFYYFLTRFRTTYIENNIKLYFNLSISMKEKEFSKIWQLFYIIFTPEKYLYTL